MRAPDTGAAKATGASPQAAAEKRKKSAQARRLVDDIAQRHFGERARNIVARNGGLTNSVFEFKVSKGEFIVRTHENATKINDYLKEQWAMDAARAAGVPTPHVLEVGNFADGRPYMIAERIRGSDGCTAPLRLALAESLGRAAARLHTVRTQGFGPVFDWSSNKLSRHETWGSWMASGFGVERRLAILMKHRMIDRRQCTRLRRIGAAMAGWRKRPVLHQGDLRLKNAIVGADGSLLSILDWETCVSTPGPFWDLSLALHDLGIDEKEAFLAGYGMNRRAFEAVLPFVRFFNVLNYAPAVEHQAKAEEPGRPRPAAPATPGRAGSLPDLSGPALRACVRRE